MAPRPTEFTDRPLRVLLVEDDFLVALHLEAILTDRGHEVVGPAASVREALGLVAAGVDAAVLDIDLAGETSLPVAEALAALRAPFVFVSGRVEREMPDALRDAPRLSKPVRPSALLEALEAEAASRGG